MLLLGLEGNWKRKMAATKKRIVKKASKIYIKGDKSNPPRVKPVHIAKYDTAIHLYKCACAHGCKVMVWSNNISCSLCREGHHV